MARPGSPLPPLPALTSARFFAALVVVLHHYRTFLPYPDWLDRLAAHGQAGVCFFFVLSGFILTYNYHDWFENGGDAGLRRAFYSARFARVYPMHLVTLLLATPLTLLIYGIFAGGPHASWHFLGATWLAHLTLVQAWVPVPLVQYIWNSASWSISAEFLFYLVFPFAIAGLASRGLRPGRLLALAALVWAIEVGAVVALGLYALGAGPWPVELGQGSLTWIVSAWAPIRLGEFLVGCVLGIVFMRERRLPSAVFAAFRDDRSRNVLVFGAAAVAYGLCWLPSMGGAGGFVLWVARHHVLFVPAFAVIILALAHGPSLGSPLLERPSMLLLGEASYSLYLLHGLPLLLLGHVVMPTGPAIPLLTLVATILTSLACYRWIETPARRWLRARGGEPSARQAA